MDTYKLGYGESLSEIPDAARWAMEYSAFPYEVEGQGLGATLIKREVLEKVEFRGFMGTACDGYFALDCQKHGFQQVANLACISGHIDGESVIWPDPTAPELYRMTPV